MIPSEQLLNQDTIDQLKNNNSVGTLTKEQWYELVKLPKSLKNKECYSFTIELYESMPKYVDYQGTQSPEAIQKREFMYRGVPLNLHVQAAVISCEDGTLIQRYPGPTEELIEEALRKIAIDGRVDEREAISGVSFSLYQLRKELARTGHTRSLPQIKQSLDILSLSSMLVTGESNGKKLKIASAIFQSMSMSSKIDDKDGSESRCRVVFHPLVYHSFLCGTHRLVNYDKCMNYKANAAKRIHKRMSHNFTQAAPDLPYKISMNNLLSDFGMKVYKYPKITFDRKLKGALEELVITGTISRYEVEAVVGDYTLLLYPSAEFVMDIKKANFWSSISKQLRATLVKSMPDFPDFG